MSGRVEWDDSRWPLVTVSVFGEVDDVDFRAYLDLLDQNLARNHPTVIVFDAREAGRTPARHRRWQGDWIKTNFETLERLSLGTAYVFESPTTRFILSTIFLIQKPPGPYLVCAGMDEAYEWAAGRMRESGVELPRA